MAYSHYQGHGNQGWSAQYTGVNGNTSNFPQSSHFQGVNGGVCPRELASHTRPNPSLGMYQPRQPDNTYQQMQGAVDDDLLSMPMSFHDNPFQSHDPTNTSFESINEMLLEMGNRERSSSRRTPHHRVVNGRVGRRVSSNNTLSSYTSGDGSGYSGTTDPTTLSSADMYKSDMGFGAAMEVPYDRNHGITFDFGQSQGFYRPVGDAALPQAGQLSLRSYAYKENFSHPVRLTQLSDTRSTTDASSLSSAEISCPESECGKTFHGEYRKGNLARHQKQVHKNQASFKCASCERLFRRGDARLKHYRKEHKDLVVDNPFVRRIRPTNGERAHGLEGISGDRE